MSITNAHVLKMRCLLSPKGQTLLATQHAEEIAPHSENKKIDVRAPVAMCNDKKERPLPKRPLGLFGFEPAATPLAAVRSRYSQADLGSQFHGKYRQRWTYLSWLTISSPAEMVTALPRPVNHAPNPVEP